jgi:hypothetical protein
VGKNAADCHKKQSPPKKGLFLRPKWETALRAVINGPCLLVDVAEQSKRHLSTLETNLNRDLLVDVGNHSKTPQKQPFFAKSLILLTKIDRFFKIFQIF